MWTAAAAKLVSLKWLRVTSDYKRRQRHNTTIIFETTAAEPMRSIEPYGFSIYVHGRTFPGRSANVGAGGLQTDVISANIMSSLAPYCDPDMVTLGLRVFEQRGAGVFLDVGSNLGSCALTWAAMGHQVFAVEPMTVNANLIRQSIDANRWRPRGNITVLPFGAADQSGDSTLYLSPGNAGDNRVGASGKRKAAQTARSNAQSDTRLQWQCEEIKLRRLDEVIPQSLHIDVAKFDVQGYELKAMLGLSSVMNRKSGGGGVDYVYFEADAQRLRENGSSLEAITQLLRRLGYRNMKSDRKDMLFSNLGGK
jgi:FkbM family methyltransferase